MQISEHKRKINNYDKEKCKKKNGKCVTMIFEKENYTCTTHKGK